MAYTDPGSAVTGVVAPAALWNTGVRDNMRALFHPIHKLADQPVTSSTVLVDDNTLQEAIAASQALAFRFVLATTGPGFLKVALNAPAGATGWWAQNRTDAGAVQMNAQFTATFVDGETKSTTATPDLVILTGYCLNSTTPGTFKLRWAQVASNGTATIIKQGSWLEVHGI